MAHKSHTALTKQLEAAADKVVVGALYAHYKQPQNYYRVTGLAILEATDEPCVIYQAEYGDRVTFVRPVSSWLESVVLNGVGVKRFTKIR